MPVTSRKTIMGHPFNFLICSALFFITTATAQTVDLFSGVPGDSITPASKTSIKDSELSNEKSQGTAFSVDKANLSEQGQQNATEPSLARPTKKKKSIKKKFKHKHLPTDAAFVPPQSKKLTQQKADEPKTGSQEPSMDSPLLNDKRTPEKYSANEIFKRIETVPPNVQKNTKLSKPSFYVYRSPEIDDHPSSPRVPIKTTPNSFGPPKKIPVAKPKQSPTDETASFASEMNLAELGDSGAQLHVGMKLYQEKGPLQDRKKGFDWILKAAEDGKFSPESLNILGRAYFYGVDTEKNYPEARKWLSLSSDQDNYTAKNDLAYMLYNGLGGDRDYAKAFELYKQASRHGDVLAQANLGTMYATGTGTVIDKARAYAWYTFAANQGNIVAAKNRNELLTDLSWEELNQAQKIAVELYNEVENHKDAHPTINQEQYIKE